MNRQVFIYDYFTILISSSLNVEGHSHIAHQISISLDSNMLKLNQDGVDLESRFFFIPSKTKHRFLSEECHNLTILIDDEASLNKKIDLENIKEAFIEDVRQDLSHSSITLFLKRIGLLSEATIDPRISQSLDFIKSQENLQSIRVEDVASHCGLSQGRFLHLFTEQMNVPFRKYILWQKIKRFILNFDGVKDLASLALEAGFSDQAHLSNYFKNTFGVSPKEILKNSTFLQDK